jgi:hypothetical protein
MPIVDTTCIMHLKIKKLGYKLVKHGIRITLTPHAKKPTIIISFLPKTSKIGPSKTSCTSTKNSAHALIGAILFPISAVSILKYLGSSSIDMIKLSVMPVITKVVNYKTT